MSWTESPMPHLRKKSLHIMEMYLKKASNATCPTEPPTKWQCSRPTLSNIIIDQPHVANKHSKLASVTEEWNL